MQFKDYYRTLGVSRDETAENIKKAFRKLARKYHPDISKEPDAEQRMKDLNEAYAVLSDPEKRAAYDQLGRGYQTGQEFRPPPDWDTGFEFSTRDFPGYRGANEFSDFFTQLFGQMGNAHAAFRSRTGRFHARGEDRYAKVLLDIEDAFTGPTRQISLRIPQTDAQGRVSLSDRTLNVRIPVGIHDGQRIRLAGQGAPGNGGAPPGDLMLEIHFRPHERYRLAGRDLHLELPVTPWEATLGAIVTVALPDKEMKVRIPAGAQSGRQLRVRGKGLPGNPPGDILLDIQVVLPPADTPRARQLYETMARELPFDPRDRKNS